jgi:hypothetical protein
VKHETMGCSRESIRSGFHFQILQPDGNFLCANKPIEKFCLLGEFQNISVVTDNLVLMKQGLENFNIAGNVCEIPLSLLLLLFLK